MFTKPWFSKLLKLRFQDQVKLNYGIHQSYEKFLNLGISNMEVINAETFICKFVLIRYKHNSQML